MLVQVPVVDHGATTASLDGERDAPVAGAAGALDVVRHDVHPVRHGVLALRTNKSCLLS